MDGTPGRDQPPATWREFFTRLMREAIPAERCRAAVLVVTLAACALVLLGAVTALILAVAGVLR